MCFMEREADVMKWNASLQPCNIKQASKLG